MRGWGAAVLVAADERPPFGSAHAVPRKAILQRRCGRTSQLRSRRLQTSAGRSDGIRIKSIRRRGARRLGDGRALASRMTISLCRVAARSWCGRGAFVFGRLDVVGPVFRYLSPARMPGSPVPVPSPRRPDGLKKAYVRLTTDYDALDVANKIGII